ncbi:MAG: LytTR family DNA-binding domain-containing protein [Ferruginibacter sp.]
MQIKCVAIDNEPWALELIKKYVSKVPALSLIKTLYDTGEGSDYLKDHQVDLLFIDINLPSSIDLLRSLKNKPITIFTTAYKKYALKGFELGILDYLLKPVDFDRFSKAVSRAIELHKFRQHFVKNQTDFILVKTGHTMTKIALDDIEYVEGFVDYIKIHTGNDKPVISLMTLKAITEKLPAEKFRRIHRSYIVSIQKIKSIQNKKLLLFSSKELPISESNTAFIKEWKKQ